MNIKDFGEQITGTVLEHVFVLPKTPKKIKADCGCTSTSVDGNKLKVVYTVPKYHELLQSSRNRVKGVTVEYTDNTTQRYLIKVKIK